MSLHILGDKRISDDRRIKSLKEELVEYLNEGSSYENKCRKEITQ